MNPDMQKVAELVTLIRNKKPCTTSLFLAMYETLPRSTWDQAISKGIMTASEYHGCLLVLKQYRRLQAKSAIKIINDIGL